MCAKNDIRPDMRYFMKMKNLLPENVIFETDKSLTCTHCQCGRYRYFKKVEAEFEAYETIQVNMVNLLFVFLNYLLAHLNQRGSVEASLGSVDLSCA